MNKFLARLVAKLLASPAQGTMGFIGLAKQAAWGSATAATDYMEALSENLSTGIDRFPTRNQFGALYEPDDYAGLRRSSGSVVHAANAVTIGHFLKGFFNDSSITVVASGALWSTHFVGARTAFSSDTPRPPFTLEIHRDVTSSHRYTDCVVNELTFALAPNQDLRMTAALIAKSRSLIARSTPTFVSSPSDPFTFDTASISIGGAATARVEALTIQMQNNLEGIPTLNGTNEIARIRASGPQLIRISGTLEYTDVTEEQDFINQTERTFTLNLTRANSFSLLFEFPRMVYNAFPVGNAGRGRLMVSFQGIARTLQSSLSAIRTVLTTIKSNY